MKQKELASLFSVSVSTVKKWNGEGFPKEGLKEQIAWVRANRPLSTGGITEARERKIQAEARMKEYDLMVRQGQLISRTEAGEHIGAFCNEVKNRFLQLNRTLPPQLYGREEKEWADIIKRNVRGILQRFYDQMKKIAKRHPGGEI